MGHFATNKHDLQENPQFLLNSLSILTSFFVFLINYGSSLVLRQFIFMPQLIYIILTGLKQWVKRSTVMKNYLVPLKWFIVLLGPDSV